MIAVKLGMDTLLILVVSGVVIVMLTIVTAYVLGAVGNEHQHQADDKQKADEIKQAIADSDDNADTTNRHNNIGPLIMNENISDDTKNDGVIAINPDEDNDDN